MKKKQKQQGYNFTTKEIKRNNYYNDDYKKVISFLIIMVVIAGLFGLLFFFNGKYVTKDHFQDGKTTEGTTTTAKFDESVIIVDDMFKIKDNEYYVLLYDASDKLTSSLYKSLASSFEDDKIEMYTVDLSSQMNKKYYDKSGKENTEPKSSKDVLVTGPTLIKFKKGKVTSYVSGKDKIVDKLKKK